MAVRPIRIFLLIVIMIAAGAGAVLYARFRLRLIHQERIERFVETYTALSLASGLRGSNPESLSVVFDSIYAANKTDSVWISAFASSLADDIHRGAAVWDIILARLDSLRAPMRPDTAAAQDTEY
jgi:hypothetical protein